MNLVVSQQLAGDPGILTNYHINLLQNLQNPKGNVFEIPQGGGAEENPAPPFAGFHLRYLFSALKGTK